VLNSKPVKERKNFVEELTDDETAILGQLCDVITIIAMGRQKNEEEANQLIKLPSAESFGNGTSSELVLVLPQLVFWLEYAIDREDRLQLFQ
jgi:hypothetical protein